MALLPVLLAQRIISGRGILRVPEATTNSRFLILNAELIRLSTTGSFRFDWSPPQSFYARLAFSRAGFIVGQETMLFANQSWDFIADIAGQGMIATKCAYEGTLQTFFNLGNALNLPSISIANSIIDFQNINLLFDQVNVSCFADTALQLSLYGVDYDSCNPANNPAPIGIPTFPAHPAQIPQGQAIANISPPYSGGAQGESGDDGLTVPFPSDQLPPGVNSCLRIRNKGLQSGDTVFENFVCAKTYATPSSALFEGRETVSIVAYNADGTEAFRVDQASFESNPVEFDFVANDSVRQPANSFGSCAACNR